ncbi:MAG: hypothetical protein AB8E15_06470 [Bdellovibrionales bacterium]
MKIKFYAAIAASFMFSNLVAEMNPQMGGEISVSFRQFDGSLKNWVKPPKKQNINKSSSMARQAFNFRALFKGASNDSLMSYAIQTGDSRLISDMSVQIMFQDEQTLDLTSLFDFSKVLMIRPKGKPVVFVKAPLKVDPKSRQILIGALHLSSLENYVDQDGSTRAVFSGPLSPEINFMDYKSKDIVNETSIDSTCFGAVDNDISMDNVGLITGGDVLEPVSEDGSFLQTCRFKKIGQNIDEAFDTEDSSGKLESFIGSIGPFSLVKAMKSEKVKVQLLQIL